MISNYSQFFDYCRSLSDVQLFTNDRKKEFSVEIENNSLFFVPKSSGIRRNADEKKTQEVLESFNRYNERKQSYYKKITYNASYILAVLHYEKNKS